jgi:hypothetical protein
MTAATTAGAASHGAMEWHAIEWQHAHQTVPRLQARIVKATPIRGETALLAERWKGLSGMKGNFHVPFLGDCALQVHKVQLPEMAALIKRSQQSGTESCVVYGNVPGEA